MGVLDEGDELALNIRIEDEWGGVVYGTSDHKGVLLRLLPHEDTPTYACLRFIGPYSDTIFNGRQADVLYDELRRMREAAEDGADRDAPIMNEIYQIDLANGQLTRVTDNPSVDTHPAHSPS